jgi:tetratricopeptide (TPR) repeat protein
LTIDVYKAYKSPLAFLIPLAVFIIPRILIRVFWKDFYIARELMKQRKFQEAIEKYEAFLNEIQNKPWLKYLMMMTSGIYTRNLPAVVYNNIASCYINASQLKKGRAAINESIKLDDQYAIAYYNLAIVDIIENKIKSAKKNYHKANELGLKTRNFDNFVSNIQKVYNISDQTENKNKPEEK